MHLQNSADMKCDHNVVMYFSEVFILQKNTHLIRCGCVLSTVLLCIDCLWCGCVFIVSGVGVYLFSMVWLCIYCLWCGCVFIVYGVGVYLLSIVWLCIYCLWCGCVFIVYDVVVYLLSTVWLWIVPCFVCFVLWFCSGLHFRTYNIVNCMH